MNGQRQKQDDEAICVHPETGFVTEEGSERSGLRLTGALVTRDRRRVVGSTWNRQIGDQIRTFEGRREGRLVTSN